MINTLQPGRDALSQLTGLLGLPWLFTEIVQQWLGMR
jgi:hypothetical protein